MTRNKLSIKIAIWIVGVSTALTVLTSLFYLQHEYQNKLDNFEKHLLSVKKNKEKILEISIWHYDTAAIIGILEDIVDSKAVLYAHIKLSDSTIYKRGVKQYDNILEKKFIFRKESSGHIYKIGELLVQGNLNFVKSQIAESLFHMMFFEFVKVVLMSLFVLLLVRKLFINKLGKLSRYASSLHLDNLNEDLHLKLPKNKENFDELDFVVESFNTMRKNLLNEIRNSNKIKEELVAFRQAVEQSYNSIVITDTQRRIMYVNEVFEKITGYSKQEVLGKNPSILKPSSAQALYYKQMNDTLEKGEVWKGELINIRKDGSYFYEQASIIPIYIEDKLVNYLAIKLDITDYKESLFKINKLNAQLEKKVKLRTSELEEKNDELILTIDNLETTKNKLLETEKVANIARKQAEDANREKSMFLANVSHELKTPLNGITGLVYLTQLKTKDEDIINNLENINTYSETLLRMISDLLDISKLDAKKIKIIDGSFNIKKILKSMNEIYQLECKKKKVKFLLDYSDSIPNKLIGDSTRIHQVISNLINNAIKFTNTKNGYVSLDVHCDYVNDKRVKLTFKVQDNGIGIKEEDLKSIFEPFYQTKESLNHYAGGSGLGLNICKNIIEQMNGIIYVESTLNKGSSFFVTLELPIDFKEDMVIKQSQLPQNMESDTLVLVVDDNVINLDVMEGILTSVNVKCVLAKNGQEAIELVEKHPFDLVITDIKMPIMDGCELTRRIRLKYSREELPVIIISANEDNHCDGCVQSCAPNDYIQKPIDPKVFLNVFSKYVTLTQSLPQASMPLNYNSNDTLDVTEALKRFVNNEKLYKRSLKDFLMDILTSSDTIAESLSQEHVQDAIDYLHTIKGLSGNLSVKRLSKTATKFHDAIKYGQDYDAIFNKYKKEVNAAKDAIDIYLQEDEVIEVETELSENENLEDKDTILKELLSLTSSYNTKSVQYFDTIPQNLQSDSLIIAIKEDIQKYQFKEATQKIEEYFNKE